MVLMCPGNLPGQWILQFDDDDRAYLLAGLDFARAYLGPRTLAESVGDTGRAAYDGPAAFYQSRLNLFEQALAADQGITITRPEGA